MRTVRLKEASLLLSLTENEKNEFETLEIKSKYFDSGTLVLDK